MRKIKTAAVIIAAIVVAVVIVIGCAAVAIVNPATSPQSGTTQQEDAEDCDAEDWINREDDCGFVSPKPVKTSAPKTAPKTGATRR